MISIENVYTTLLLQIWRKTSAFPHLVSKFFGSSLYYVKIYPLSLVSLSILTQRKLNFAKDIFALIEMIIFLSLSLFKCYIIINDLCMLNKT